MKRWSTKAEKYGAFVENEKIDAFLADVIQVCIRHGFSISHEDPHGAFKVERFSDEYADWLMNAHDAT